MITELREEDQIVSKLRDTLGGDVSEVKIPRPRRIFIQVSKKTLKKAIQYLAQEAGFNHISTITGVDTEEQLESIYHLTHDGRIELSLKVQTPKDNPVLPTITDIIPGATLYEREVHELLGITFEGHPDLSPLVLPEGWPQDIYPLRKEWTIEKIQKKVTKGGEQ